MKIGIDCRTILHPSSENLAGISHYVYFLTDALVKHRNVHWVLFFDASLRGKTRHFERRNTECVFVKNAGRVPISHHVRFAALVKKHRVDVFHGPANILPLTYGGASVVTIHDLAIYFHPEWFPGNQGFATKVLVPKSIKKARAVIAVSQSTKDSLVARFKTNAQKIHVVYEGFTPRQQKTLAQESLWEEWNNQFLLEDTPYVLFLGTIEPRKNLVRLIKAFNLVLAKNPRLQNHQLILAGQRGWKYEEVMRQVARSAFGHRIKLLGYVSHADKLQLMRNAKLFVFPSLWEGFGLPVVEAMSLGTPVVTSNVSSLPEIVGRSAVTVNPESVQAIAKGIVSVLTSPARQKRMAIAGKRRAKRFTWERAAAETMEIYEKISSKL